MGLGLSSYIPIVVYSIAPLIIFLTIFIRVELGIFYLVPLLPLTSILLKVRVYPLGKDLVDIMLVSILIGWVIQKKEQLLEDSPLNRIILILFFTNAIAVMRGHFFTGEGLSMESSQLQVFKNFAILPLLYFITVNNIKDKKILTILIVLMACSMLVMGVNFQNTFKWIKKYHFSYDSRLGGMFVYLGPNEFAAFFAQYTFPLLGIILFDKEKIKRIIFAIISTFNLYVVMYTYSRSSYLAVLVATPFICFFRNKKLIIPIFIVLISWRFVLPVSVIERIDMSFVNDENVAEESQKSDNIDIGGTTLDTTGRRKVWEAALEIFSKNPLIGTGYNTFLSIVGYDAHCQYLKILAEQGIIGFFIFVAFLYQAFKTGWRLFKTANDRFLKGLGIGFTACVIVVMVGNLTGDHWTYYNLMAFFWVFLGLVVRGIMITNEESTTVKAQ